jgi:hypothetical protein
MRRRPAREEHRRRCPIGSADNHFSTGEGNMSAAFAARKWRTPVAALVWLLAGLAPLCAQSVTATAEVPVAAPSGGGARNLAFGEVVPQPGQTVVVSVPAAVAPITGTMHSGEFRLNLESVRGVTISVQPPPSLANATASLAIDYNDLLYGAYCVDTGAGCALTSFNPATTDQLRICRQSGASGNCHPNQTFPLNSILSVFIGGGLAVPPTQRAGLYTGTVTLTIVQVH